MQVQEIMARDVKSCRLDTNLAAVTEILWTNGCGVLPVVDEAGRVIAMITDRDICIAAGTRNWVPSEIRVSDVVPRKIYTCAPADDIHRALKTMQAQKVRRLPVVGKDGSLKGILCLDDVVLQAGKSDALTYSDVIETLKAICERPVPQRAAAA